MFVFIVLFTLCMQGMNSQTLAHRPSACASNYSDPAGDTMALLQVTSNLQKQKPTSERAYNDPIFDIDGKTVEIDTVYHAFLQISMGRGWGLPNKKIFVEMSPKAVVSLANPDDITQEVYLMFESNLNFGQMATLDKENEFRSNTLGLAKLKTLQQLSDYWRSVQEKGNGSQEWHPENYNCQTFARDMFGQLARYKDAMKEAVTVLGHDTKTITWNADVSTDIAGSVANAFGSFMTLFDGADDEKNMPLESLSEASQFKDKLGVPIASVSLYYAKAGGTLGTFGTTSTQGRVKDYNDRRANLGAYQEKEVSAGNADWW